MAALAWAMARLSRRRDIPAGGSSGRPITLVLDGQRFNLSAEDSVAEALTRTVLGQQRRRAGRMPAWFGA